MTACRRFIDSTALAKFVGSSTSNGGGVLMVPTAQKRQPLVHSWPAIINVASPLAQQSWMFGQRASWQTVWSVLSFTAAFVVLKMACCSPDGRAVLNHGGRRSRFGLGRDAGGVRSAIGSGLPDIASSPYELPTACLSKRCAVVFLSPSNGAFGV